MKEEKKNNQEYVGSTNAHGEKKRFHCNFNFLKCSFFFFNNSIRAGEAIFGNSIDKKKIIGNSFDTLVKQVLISLSDLVKVQNNNFFFLSNFVWKIVISTLNFREITIRAVT